MSTKVRKTLTLDDDVVAVFAADDPDNLSGAVNAALAAEAQRRMRKASLAQLVADLTELHGPSDPSLLDEMRALLA